MPTARTYVLNIILAFMPDLLVAWAAAEFTDSGWSGFFITLLVLQAIYFFLWGKNRHVVLRHKTGRCAACRQES
jgi:hypothetical protein